jgi:hypothetical protein
MLQVLEFRSPGRFFIVGHQNRPDTWQHATQFQTRSQAEEHLFATFSPGLVRAVKDLIARFPKHARRIHRAAHMICAGCRPTPDGHGGFYVPSESVPGARYHLMRRNRDLVCNCADDFQDAQGHKWCKHRWVVTLWKRAVVT